MNSYTDELELNVEARLEKNQVRLRVRPRVDEPGNVPLTAPSISRAEQMAREYGDLRRLIKRLERSPAFNEIENEVTRLQRLKARSARRRRRYSDEVTRRARLEEVKQLARLPTLQAAVDRLETLRQQVMALEDEVLVSLYQRETLDADFTFETGNPAAEWTQLLTQVYRLQFEQPDDVTLGLFSESPEALFKLAAAYHELARRRSARIVAEQVRAGGGARRQERPLTRTSIDDLPRFLRSPVEGVIGLLLGIHGDLVYPQFMAEQGLHIFIEGTPENEERTDCLVVGSELGLPDYVPPAGVERRGVISRNKTLRSYDNIRRVIKDHEFGVRIWPHEWLEEVLEGLFAQRRTRALDQLIEP